MDKKQTEEMAKIICPSYGDKECYKSCFYSDCIAEVQSEELYNAGYHKPEWISVEDRLPENKVNCIVYYKHAYCDNDGYWAIGVSFYDGNEFQIGLAYKVTHWMYLPSPPKKEN